ncbi:MAG: 3-hydroxyacyl-ACP dehydratase FabZ [bacterium]
MKIEIKEIMKLIPQRYPFLFVDRVEELVEDKSIVAVKNISIDEPFFTGHFPDTPTLPGVIIIEALAQTSGILAAKSLPQGIKGIPYLVGVNNFKFRQPVVPGDSVRLESSIKKRIRNFTTFECKAYVNGKIVAEGEILTAIVEEAK